MRKWKGKRQNNRVGTNGAILHQSNQLQHFQEDQILFRRTLSIDDVLQLIKVLFQLHLGFHLQTGISSQHHPGLRMVLELVAPALYQLHLAISPRIQVNSKSQSNFLSQNSNQLDKYVFLDFLRKFPTSKWCLGALRCALKITPFHISAISCFSFLFLTFPCSSSTYYPFSFLSECE